MPLVLQMVTNDSEQSAVSIFRADVSKAQSEVQKYLYMFQWVLGTLSLWVKQSVREADNSSPSSAEVKE
jgi:hypothetical protein